MTRKFTAFAVQCNHQILFIHWSLGAKKYLISPISIRRQALFFDRVKEERTAIRYRIEFEAALHYMHPMSAIAHICGSCACSNHLASMSHSLPEIRPVTMRLRYAGAVGTGFSDAVATALRKRLDAIVTPRCAIAGLKGKGAVWVLPDLTARIAYRCPTTAGELRLASFEKVVE